VTIEKHLSYTKSEKAQYILDDWENLSKKFAVVVPRVYKRITDFIKVAKDDGMSDKGAALYAFTKNRDAANK